jgi:hypothetical protein
VTVRPTVQIQLVCPVMSMRRASRLWPATIVAHGAVMLHIAPTSLAAIAVTSPPRGTGLTGNVRRAVESAGSDGDGLTMFVVGSGPVGSGSVVASGGSDGTAGDGTASEGNATDGSGASVTAGGASVGGADTISGADVVAAITGSGAGVLGVSDLAGAHAATANRTTHHRLVTRTR